MILLDLSRTCYTSTQHPPMAHHVTQSKSQSPYNGQHLLALPPLLLLTLLLFLLQPHSPPPTNQDWATLT